MSRETIDLNLPKAGVSITHYAYLTAREMFGFTKADDSQKFLIQALVTKVGDETDKDKLFEKILDLHIEDYILLDRSLMKLIPETGEKKT